MTNGELFIRENPTIEVKINGSCVWIYFDGVNHYTMPVKWWDKEIDVLNKIRAEISEFKDDKIIHAERNEMIDIVLEILDKYKAESEPQEISDRNLKMWEDIYAEEKRRERNK